MVQGSGTTTLRHLLTQSKPPVPCTARNSRNTSKSEWPELKPASISRWDDFNFETLNRSYGFLLDLELPLEELRGAPEAATVLRGVAITTHAEIQQLIVWNDSVLQPALNSAKKLLNLHVGVELKHMLSLDNTPFYMRPGDGPSVRVDHCVALDDVPSFKLVMGLGRPASKVQAHKLFTDPDKTSLEHRWPLRQLANLCEEAQTRYGYIMTEENLTVCCFYRKEASSGEAARANVAGRPARTAVAADAEWLVAIMPVPWTRHGESQLITDLALWWLCMLALSGPENRALVTKDQTVGINEWPVVVADDGSVVLIHPYSGVQEPFP
ncbi:hypothetical protein F5Y16DRAFT_419781 [Xylariaceae sp. FL0255]|nr:hypothetical protein F5Y16DRAFT_419781 [Xylariaceae sp. FL0255]